MLIHPIIAVIKYPILVQDNTYPYSIRNFKCEFSHENINIKLNEFIIALQVMAQMLLYYQLNIIIQYYSVPNIFTKNIFTQYKYVLSIIYRPF